ncbi:MAG: thymidine phosphorylase, partial [Actinomycetota bacterium]|nr:thymidine phosphorylase [Actinomycetota bacterium]
RLGAGRARKEDAVSPSAGVRCLVRPGERVQAGAAVLELHADDEARLPEGRAALQGAFEVSAPDVPGAGQGHEPAPRVLGAVRA